MLFFDLFFKIKVRILNFYSEKYFFLKISYSKYNKMCEKVDDLHCEIVQIFPNTIL